MSMPFARIFPCFSNYPVNKQVSTIQVNKMRCHIAGWSLSVRMEKVQTEVSRQHRLTLQPALKLLPHPHLLERQQSPGQSSSGASGFLIVLGKELLSLYIHCEAANLFGCILLQLEFWFIFSNRVRDTAHLWRWNMQGKRVEFEAVEDRKGFYGW